MSHGPTNVCLNATYRNVDGFEFQDEVGRLTLGVCKRVAHGVLLFVSSYRMLTKLSERWQQTGLWEQITTKKVIVTEPRYTDEFESAMRHFYEVTKFLGYKYLFV